MLSDLLFSLLLGIFCALFVFAHYASAKTASATNAKSVVLFKTSHLIGNILDTNSKPFPKNDVFIEPENFYSSFLVAADEMIVAITGVNSTQDHEGNIDVLTKYIETKGQHDWITKVTESTNNKETWTTQFAVKEKWENTDNLEFLLAAAQNNKIHILLVNKSAQDPGDASTIAPKWDFSFFVGTINSGTSEKIMWSINTHLNEQLKKDVKEKLLYEIPSNAFFLLTKNENLFFVLQFNNDNNKITFVFIQFEETGTTVNFADLNVETNDGCTYNLFAWKEKIMLAEYCKESSSMHELQLNDETTWKGTAEPISRLLHNLQNKKDFTVVKIDNESVLLFTQKKEIAEVTGGKKTCIDLWITDGIRLYNVGSIVSSKNEVISAGLLYTKEQLFFFAQQNRRVNKYYFYSPSGTTKTNKFNIGAMEKE